MEELIRWLSVNEKKLHPVELAGLFHHRIVFIHPFFDGNGRTARLAMNILLMRRGFPLAIILKNDRKKYYRVLQSADRGNAAPLILFIAQTVERTLDLYLRTFEKTGNESLMTLAEAGTGTPYSPKYLNLLARSGKLDVTKRGRVWVTTQEAIERYKTGRLRKRI